MEQSPDQAEAQGAQMHLQNSTRFRAHAPGHKHNAHCFLAHDNDGFATPQNRFHIRTLHDAFAQSTKRLMTSDLRAPRPSPADSNNVLMELTQQHQYLCFTE